MLSYFESSFLYSFWNNVLEFSTKDWSWYNSSCKELIDFSSKPFLKFKLFFFCASVFNCSDNFESSFFFITISISFNKSKHSSILSLCAFANCFLFWLIESMSELIIDCFFNNFSCLALRPLSSVWSGLIDLLIVLICFWLLLIFSFKEINLSSTSFFLLLRSSNSFSRFFSSNSLLFKTLSADGPNSFVWCKRWFKSLS